MRKVTTVKGKLFATTASAAKWISEGRPVFLHHKYVHASWAMQWKLAMIAMLVSAKSLYRAARYERTDQ